MNLVSTAKGQFETPQNNLKILTKNKLMSNSETLITGILAPSWFQIVEFSQFFIISTL